MISDSDLTRFIGGFFGYGNLDAPLWFVGMEEGGGNSWREIQARISAWRNRGERQVEDLEGYHRAIGITHWFGSHPKSQPTWSKLIRIVFGYRGVDPSLQEIKRYQSEQLGRFSGETCLLELLPLPSPSVGTWLYGEKIGIPELRDRQAYRRRFLPVRISAFQRLIKQHCPRVIVFYGFGYQIHWQDILQRPLEETTIEGKPVLFSGGGETKVTIIQHPAARGVTNRYFFEVGRFLNLLTVTEPYPRVPELPG